MRPRQAWILFVAAAIVAMLRCGPLPAAEVVMKSGFRLEGRLGKVSGLAENPLKPDGKSGEIDNRLIVLVDDGLRRSFVCTYAVREARESEPVPMTTIRSSSKSTELIRRL